MVHDALTAGDSFAAAHFDPAVVERMLEDHDRGFADHSQRLYALLMLELWRRGVG
jgi:hypothetical protein